MKNKITAVISTRAGSARVKQKNIRKFGDSTLLDLKIEKIKELKKIGQIHHIILNSDCPVSWDIARDHGIEVHKREPYYASSECPITEYWKYCAEHTKTNTMLLAQVTSPFISVKTYQDCLDKYRASSCDSLISVTQIKEYMWKGKSPINYEWPTHPKSQDLPDDIFFLNFGVCIISKEALYKNKNLVTRNTLFYNSPASETYDIDSEFDFSLSEHIYNSRNKSSEFPRRPMEDEYFWGHGY